MKNKKDPTSYKRLDCPVAWDAKSIEKSAAGELSVLGYANTKDRDRVGDIVEPTAFTKTLPEFMNNPVLLYMHDWDKVIGKIIHAEVDEKGLKVKAKISGAKDCEDIRTKIKEGILGTFSIGYNELDADWDEETGTNVVKDVELLEVSVVSIPANPQAKFAAEADEEKEDSEEEEKSAINLVQELKTLIEDTKMTKKELEELTKGLRAKSAKASDEEKSEETTEETQEEEKSEETQEEEKTEETTEEEKSEESSDEEKMESEESHSQEEEGPQLGDVLKTLAEKVDLLSDGMASMLEMFHMMTAEGSKMDDSEEDEEEEEEKSTDSDEEKELEDMTDEEGLALLEGLSDELEEVED